ncbi:MAG: (2Fe-2S)-binding protein [Planctomycetes bacterium]|nr:(2Fe-2S)-binding protein [Planctomycetota bacterium]
MPKLTIDGREVTVPEGSSVLHAARALGVAIPSLCQRDGFEPSTSCMACVVKIGSSPTLRPSCATIVTEGMEVSSELPEVRKARRASLELLLSDHAGDCVAPCQLADERHADLPRFLRQVAEGDLGGAAATLTTAGIDLDDLDGLQVHRAEKACRRGRNDEAVALDRLIRYVAAHRDHPADAAGAPPEYRAWSVRLGRMTEAEQAALLAGARPGAAVPPADAARGYTPDEARAEALRCLHCDCHAAHSCKLRDACEEYDVPTARLRSQRPAWAIDRSHPDILHEPGKCIRCGLCLQAAERAGERFGITFAGRGFDMSVQTPFGVPLAQAVAAAAADCADVCPTAALSRRDANRSGESNAP